MSGEALTWKKEKEEAPNPLLKKYDNLGEALSDMINIAQDVLEYICKKYGEQYIVKNMLLALALTALAVMEGEGELKSYLTLVEKLYKLKVALGWKEKAF